MRSLRTIIKYIYIKATNFKRIKIGKGSYIHPKAILNPGLHGYISIGENCYIHKYSILECYGKGKIFIGNDVSVNPFCVLYGIGDLKIGDGVRIATQCVCIPANHNFEDKNEFIYKQGVNMVGIIIESNVWLGAGVKVLDGVKIGRHSVIAAGAVVTKDVDSNSVYAGIPAKLIKKI